MRTIKRFSDDILTVLQESKGLRLRAGSAAHHFIGISVVVVKGRVFIRSWSVKPNGGWQSLDKSVAFFWPLPKPVKQNSSAPDFLSKWIALRCTVTGDLS
jgi:hypothetical protein